MPWPALPKLDARQLLHLTDDTGLFQHALHTVPDPRHGYCIDDNARALIASVRHAQLLGSAPRVIPLRRYFMFLAYAWNAEANDGQGAFRNFMGYDRRWLEDVGSPDSQGRAMWALGQAAAFTPEAGIADHAFELFQQALPAAEALEPWRSRAFAVLGLCGFLQRDPSHAAAREQLETHASLLFQHRQQQHHPDWPWWEDQLTYDNARLCEALLRAGETHERPAWIKAGLESLAWLMKVQTESDPNGRDCLSIVGNAGWYPRGGERARFDQQPLDACAMVEAALVAARLTGQALWLEHAWLGLQWFTGRNVLGRSLIHPETGGCQDGLEPNNVNKNQGAESVLAYVLSILAAHQTEAQWRAHLAKHEDRPASPPSFETTPRTTTIQAKDLPESRPLGLAVIGASGFAAFCQEAWQGLHGLNLITTHSSSLERAKGFAQAHGGRAAERLNEVFADPQIDLVHVAGRPADHAELTMQALQAGKHVLCEKPLALTPSDAAALRDEAGRRGLRLAVNFVMRYGPLSEQVESLIASGVMGAPLRGAITNRAGDAGLAPGHWFWDAAQSGGIFLEHAVHFFDLIGAWLSPVANSANVLAAHRTVRPGTGLIDQVTAEVAYGEQCRVGHYHGFTQAPPTDRQDVRLIFERGQLVVQGWVASSLQLEAALDEPSLDTLTNLMPEATLRTVERFEESGTNAPAHEPGVLMSRRHRRERVSRLIELQWQAPGDADSIYRSACRELMRDLIQAVRDPLHRLRVTPEDGVQATALATQATRLSGGPMPPDRLLAPNPQGKRHE